MEKKLSQWAKDNNVSYPTSYYWYKTGKLPVLAKKNAGGSIIVYEKEETKPVKMEAKASFYSDDDENDPNKKVTVASFPIHQTKATDYRRNRSATIERTDRFKNIEDGIVPFVYGTNQKTGNLTIRDAVILCQKAYYNVATFRNVIDLMVEFSVNDIYFKGGSSKSRDFFNALFKKINLKSFQDKFFREYYRSGNVFTYRFDTNIKQEDIEKITQTFGNQITKAASKVKLPIRYIILNPADIETIGSVSFVKPLYFKVLNPYELARLKNPQTDEDKQLYNSLDEKTKQLIQTSSTATAVIMQLDPTKVYPVFYKKQDYEPFSTSMGFPVLEDINWKLELKKMDMAISRTCQQAILLITNGDQPDKGGVNPKNLQALQEIFKSESIGRVLVADYTTKAQFIIPQIADILDPKKYELVNEDIRLGLNNILIGDEKFANQSIKVDIFVELITHGREVFLDEFLFLEVKRISQDLGFKNFPTPYYQKINIKNKLEYDKLYVRLAELGVLTPEETVDAIENDRLPTPEDSIQSQEKLKELKDKSLYEPIIMSKSPDGAEGPSTPAGRPSGTKTPKSNKKVRPIGTQSSFSMSKIMAAMKSAEKLNDSIEKELLKKHKLKTLNDAQKEISESLASIIMRNESQEKWSESIKEYLKNPLDKNKERIDEIENLAYNHCVDTYIATILFESKK